MIEPTPTAYLLIHQLHFVKMLKEKYGLLSGNFDWGQAKDGLGNIYFRKNSRFFRFHLDGLAVKTLMKPVVLTDLMVNNQKKIG